MNELFHDYVENHFQLGRGQTWFSMVEKGFLRKLFFAVPHKHVLNEYTAITLVNQIPWKSPINKSSS